MPPDDGADLDDATVAAIRVAADALSGQQGRGVARHAIVRLADASPRRLTVLGGEPPVAVVQPPRPGESSTFAELTPREREVASLVAAGLSNNEIAVELVVTLATVKDHVHRILRKTGLPTRAAVAAAWRG